MHITSPVPSDLSHQIFYAPNRDAQAEYLAIVKMALRNWVKDINFADPVPIRRVHVDLMNEVSCEGWCIVNKHNIQINPLYFE